MKERILIVDLSDNNLMYLDYEYTDESAYGRRLVLDLLEKYVPDNADRYDPENAIVIAPGLYTGNKAPSACRMFVTTVKGRGQGLEFCNTTGDMPQQLGSLGIAAVVIYGKSENANTVLHISKSGAELVNIDELETSRTSEAVHILRDRFSHEAAILGISLAGRRRLSLATFYCTYKEGNPEYHCPRSGFGDVFGSKNLTAVVVEAGSYFGRECSDEETFWTLGKEIARTVVDDEICGGALPSYGSMILLKLLKSKKSVADLPAREKVDTASSSSCGNNNTNYNCAPMCVIGCLNRHSNYGGQKYSSPALSETWGAIKNCYGIDDYELADKVQTGAAELGLVGTEYVTATKAFAVAAGIEHGENYLLEWLEEIKKDTVVGRVIASRTYGVRSLYEDADLDEWVDRKAIQDEELFDVQLTTNYPGLKKLSGLELLYAQIFVLENLGFCIFTSFALLNRDETFEKLAKMFEARTGLRKTAEELITDAIECIDEEKKYHERRWKAAQQSEIPPFTKVLYRYFDSKFK